MINKDDYDENRQQILMMATKQIITINNYHDNNQNDPDEADQSPSPSLSPSWSTTSTTRITLTAAPNTPRRLPAANAGGALLNHARRTRGHGALEDGRSPGQRPHNARRQTAAAATPTPRRRRVVIDHVEFRLLAHLQHPRGPVDRPHRRHCHPACHRPPQP